MHRNARVLVLLLGSLLTLWVVFAVGFVAGATALGRGLPPLSVVAGEPPPDRTVEAADADFGVFWEAWNVIQDNIVDGPLDPQTLRDGAIRGLAEATNDPFTLYQDPEEARRASRLRDGQFDGVGIRVQLRDGLPFIVQPLPNSPAETAGIGPNEFVLAVDGVSTEGMELADFGARVRGPRGEPVTLELRREGETASRSVTLRRARILMDSVTAEVLDDAVAYLRIARFANRTSEEVRDALLDFQAAGAERLVLDLRNNPGGLLHVSVNVASLFLPEGQLIARQEARGAGPREYRAVRMAGNTRLPMVVLVNEGTASGAEIVAGALAAHGRAVLIGAETYGKGSMQELHTLSNEAVIRVTHGVWLTPDGLNLADGGLEPHVTAANPDEQIGGSGDPVLAAGLRYLRGDTAPRASDARRPAGV